MRTLARLAVGSTVLGIALMSGQGVASAQVGSALTVDVRLDATAPSTGELVAGLRSVEGIARALEGVNRVDLYVLAAGISTRDISRAVPVDSMVSDVPLQKADFDLQWDSTTTGPKLVDLVVIARTATRTGRIEIPGVRVQRVETAQSAPTVAHRAAPVAPVAARAAAAPAVAAPKAVPKPRVARTHAPAPVAVAEVSAGQAQAFYSTYGQLPYAAGATAGSLARPEFREAAAKSGRGAVPYAAAGLVLMVTAGHVQRAVRLSPRGAFTF